MKIFCCLSILTFCTTTVCAENSINNGFSSESLSANGNNQAQSGIDQTSSTYNAMYFDFGLGLGGATEWNTNSLAINAMTMGFYMNKNFGVEIGMDVLPNGANSAGEGMIDTYHLAAKGLIPLSEDFSLYGKAGLGINAYEGETPTPGDPMSNYASVGLYTAAGVQFNFNQHFGIYLEGSDVLIPNINNNGNTNYGSFGSTYMGTIGLEARL